MAGSSARIGGAWREDPWSRTHRFCPRGRPHQQRIRLPCGAVIHGTRTAEQTSGSPELSSRDSGVVDYRLARHRLITEYRRGRSSRQELCDAQPELQRAARHAGRPTDEPCPICEDEALVLVSYVFGPKLPAHGRCITTTADLARLRDLSDEFICYLIEVCTGCWWNHLRQTMRI